MKTILIILVATTMLMSCVKTQQSNTKVNLIDGEVIHRSSSFIIIMICKDGISYLANSRGGITKHGDCR